MSSSWKRAGCEMGWTAWLESELPRALTTFLPTQRWFGGKSRRIRIVQLDDAVPLADDAAFVVVRVWYADGTIERYAMVVAFATDRADRPVIAHFDAAGAARWAVEAAGEPHAALALLTGFGAEPSRATLRGGRLLYRDADRETAPTLEQVARRQTVRPIGLEQSNTSLRLDDLLAFKLIRKLDAGENPEVEVGRFLTTQTDFRNMATLRGSITYESANGQAATVGVLQDWIASQGDGWTHVLSRLSEPQSLTADSSFAKEITDLGRTTARFHAALATPTADPAFAPEPVTRADVAGWEAALQRRASRAQDLIRANCTAWSDESRRLAEAVLGSWPSVTALAAFPGSPAFGFEKIRVHGDYHLGQVLVTAQGFVLIDFEGEPARPLEERRLKQCALKDVAGMIRSFDYASETARARHASVPDGISSERLRGIFLAGYLADGPQPWLPAGDRSILDAWIDFFEAEKALYEVEYEIRNRPGWVHIPLRGLLRLADRRAARRDPVDRRAPAREGDARARG